MAHRISRRGLLKAGAAAAGLAAFGPRGLAALDEQPNLLIVHTDQQSCWTLSAYGGTLIKTPHIDSLANEGAICTNFFTNSAMCTPSRGCFLTGRYPHAHGAYRNNVALNRDEITFAHLMARTGYETGYAGKWHLDGTAKPGWITPHRSMGFADCRYMFNRGHWKKVVEQPLGKPELLADPVIGDERTYTTDWLCGKAIEFVSQARNRPFCYMLSIPDPHTPFSVRAPYDDMFKPEDMPLPATFNQKHGPRWLATAPFKPHAAEIFRQKKARYCGAVKCIDDNVGRLLECLRSNGILDKTVIVYTTDHGEYMGEHGLMHKNQLYETAYRIPMLIRWPAKIAPRTRVDCVFSTVDFQPTLCGLLGMKGSGRAQGRDASAFLCGKSSEWADQAFIHHSTHERAGIFTPEFELAYVKDSDHILFDRRKDPDQINNLFHRPEYKGTIEKLTARIVQHHVELDSPAAKWLRELKS